MLHFNSQNNPILLVFLFYRPKNGYTAWVHLLKFLHALSVAEWKASDPQVRALAGTAGSPWASVPAYTYSTNRISHPRRELPEWRQWAAHCSPYLNTSPTSNCHDRPSCLVWDFTIRNILLKWEIGRAFVSRMLLNKYNLRKDSPGGSVPQGCDPCLSTPALWLY